MNAPHFAQFVLVLCISLANISLEAASLPGVFFPEVYTTDAFDRNNTFGWRFTLSSDIDVTALGYFDETSLPSGTGAGLAQSHQLGIFRAPDQALLASNTIPAGASAPLMGNFRYVDLNRPVRLTAGATYVMAGSALSASPDNAAAVTNWTMAPGVTFANSPIPDPNSTKIGTSMYIASVHGNPSPVLTYPALLMTGNLPIFAANFVFTFPAPQLFDLHVSADSVLVSVTNLVLGVTNTVEKSQDLITWQPEQTFVASSTATNLQLGPAPDTRAFYRVKIIY